MGLTVLAEVGDEVVLGGEAVREERRLDELLEASLDGLAGHGDRVAGLFWNVVNIIYSAFNKRY